MIDTFCDRLLSTIIGEFGIIKVLESVANKSYNQTVRMFVKELIEEMRAQTQEHKNYVGNSCSCPGCTGRG